MSFLRVARPGLGRVISNSVSHRQVRTISYANSFPKYPASGSSKAARLIAAASIISAPCLWWLLTPSDETPRYSNPPAEHLVVESGPSQEEVTEILSKNAYSFQTRGVPGVNRYDGAQLAANDPCEDRAAHGRFPSPWDDGTNTTARGAMPDEVVQSAIKKGFVGLDAAILRRAADVAESKERLQDKVKKLAVAYAGSCALLSIFDPVASTLHVACTGDSRAVLAQQGDDGKWETMFITKDQEGENEEEAARIRKEHPGEEKVVENGRVLGMMPTRVFGDVRWKWPLQLQREFAKRFYGDSPLTPRYEFKTPPYLTAEPVVTSIEVDCRKPSLLIMATDGFWHYVSPKQAVDLTAKWLDMQAVGRKGGASATLQPTYEQFDFSHFETGVQWRDVEGRTTVEDKNVAVHLVRNAVGGNHRDLVAGRLAFTAPYARRRRDDITVQVVLFNT